jgi:hypothetical protein
MPARCRAALAARRWTSRGPASSPACRVAGTASLRTDAQAVLADVKLDAAGNRAEVSGRMATTGRVGSDRWTLALHAAPLESWRRCGGSSRRQPLDQALAAPSTPRRRSKAAGPPPLRKDASRPANLVVGTSRVQQVQARWRLDARADDAALDVAGDARRAGAVARAAARRAADRCRRRHGCRARCARTRSR